LPRYRQEPFEVVCNRSILETFTRSIMTSFCTVLVIVAILAFGGATIKQFVAIILIGIISGTYSSIFNAVPILVSWKAGEFATFFRWLTGRAPAKAQV
jgi:preprotein translocase subunit SecF